MYLTWGRKTGFNSSMLDIQAGNKFLNNLNMFDRLHATQKTTGMGLYALLFGLLVFIIVSIDIIFFSISL